MEGRLLRWKKEIREGGYKLAGQKPANWEKDRDRQEGAEKDFSQGFKVS